jgi:DNA-binding transcriptional LysR family regulator
LTDAGKEYLLSCKRALQSLREGEDLLEKHRAEPAGVLRVECPVTMARDVLAPLLGRFDANPTLRVSLDVYSSGYDREPTEDIDIYFKIWSPSDSSKRIRRYPGTARGLFASPWLCEQIRLAERSRCSVRTYLHWLLARAAVLSLETPQRQEDCYARAQLPSYDDRSSGTSAGLHLTVLESRFSRYGWPLIRMS